ncbi:hypothetical protein HYFRA_00001869 [Hymenoscyphus fraxineus]|uniref:Uncharacterized protein n=1 Tax=Hymenoscyphus fraxineus TaxID=746836 RepID=A0A9N9KLA4_9HELO|nr:hypothetical protein HYFRA_00001869 [Hymenoscyphus fraxineus]
MSPTPPPPPFTYHITANTPDGTKSTFLDTSGPQCVQERPFGTITYLYSTPPSFSIKENTDLKYHESAPTTAPFRSFQPAGGSVAVTISFAPNPSQELGYMHRSNTLDFLSVLCGEVELVLNSGERRVLCGEVELVLNSGERRVLKQGEVCFQRGSWHAWRNVSATEWARMSCVALSAEGAVEGDGAIELAA